MSYAKKVYNDKNMIVDDVNLLRRAQKGIKTLNNKFGTSTLTSSSGIISNKLAMLDEMS